VASKALRDLTKQYVGFPPHLCGAENSDTRFHDLPHRFVSRLAENPAAHLEQLSEFWPDGC
jgi:hypothetical protein